MDKKYYEANKETILAKRKARRLNRSDEECKSEKERRQKYYQDNKEKIRAVSKIKRDNGAEKNLCECGNLKKNISKTCYDCKVIRFASKIKDKKIGWKLWDWSKRAILKQPFCSWCFSEDKLEVHHILHKAKFPQYMYDDNNANVLCKYCHDIIHKQGGF